MIHGPCGPHNLNSFWMGCDKGLLRKVLWGNFHEYKRVSAVREQSSKNIFYAELRWVIAPNKKYLHKKLRTHINVGICSTTQRVQYLWIMFTKTTFARLHACNFQITHKITIMKMTNSLTVDMRVRHRQSASTRKTQVYDEFLTIVWLPIHCPNSNWWIFRRYQLINIKLINSFLSWTNVKRTAIKTIVTELTVSVEIQSMGSMTKVNKIREFSMSVLRTWIGPAYVFYYFAWRGRVITITLKLWTAPRIELFFPEAATKMNLTKNDQELIHCYKGFNIPNARTTEFLPFCA